MALGYIRLAKNLKPHLFWLSISLRFSEAEPAKHLKDYVQTYLREDVMQEVLIRNITNFSRFLEVASFPQGETIGVSALAREAHTERSIADNYFSILEDLLDD